MELSAGLSGVVEGLGKEDEGKEMERLVGVQGVASNSIKSSLVSSPLTYSNNSSISLTSTDWSESCL